MRARWEGSTATLLSGKRYETFLPIFKTKKRRNGKSRELTAPLFPGYVLYQFDALNHLPFLVTQGVVAVVGRGRIPVLVEAWEMAALQGMVSSCLRTELWPYLEVGQRVRIEDGALSGLVALKEF